jgi:hypothetical protein
MEENKKIEFIKGLYGKYGVDIEDQGLQRAAQMFEQDFDSALGSFYKQFGVDKQVDPQTSLALQKDYGFYKEQAPVDQVSSLGDIAGNLKQMIPAAFEGVLAMPKILPTFVERELKDRGFDIGAKAFSFLSANPKDKFDMLSSGEYSIESEFAESMQSIIDKLKSTKPVETFDDAVSSRDMRRISMMALGNAANFIPSLAVGATTSLATGGNVVAGGAGFAGMFAGQEMASAAEAIAAESGRTISEVIKDRDESLLVPAIIGSGAAVLEIAGFKLFTKTIKGFLSTQVAKNIAINVPANVAFQSFANTVETTASVYNETHAITGDHNKAVEMAQKFVREEGAEVAKSTAAGQLAMMGIGGTAATTYKIAKRFVSDNIETTPVQEAQISEKKENTAANTEASIDAKLEAAKEATPIVDEELDSELDIILNEFKAKVAETKAEEAGAKAREEAIKENEKKAEVKAKEEEKAKPKKATTKKKASSKKKTAVQAVLEEEGFVPAQEEVLDLTETQEEVADAESRTEKEVDTNVGQDRPVRELGAPVAERVESAKVEEPAIDQVETLTEQVDEQKTEKTDGEGVKASIETEQAERPGDIKKNANKANSREAKISKALSSTQEKINKLSALVEAGNVDKKSRQTLKGSPAQIDKYIDNYGIKEGEGLEQLLDAREKFVQMIERDEAAPRKSNKSTKFEDSKFEKDFVEAERAELSKDAGSDVIVYFDKDSKRLTAVGADPGEFTRIYDEATQDWYTEEELPSNANTNRASKAVDSARSLSSSTDAKSIKAVASNISNVELARLSRPQRREIMAAAKAVAKRAANNLAEGTPSQRKAFRDIAQALKDFITPQLKYVSKSEGKSIKDTVNKAYNLSKQADEVSDKRKSSIESAKAAKAALTPEQKAEIEAKKQKFQESKRKVTEAKNKVSDIQSSINQKIQTIEATNRRVPGLKEKAFSNEGFTNMTKEQVIAEKVKAKAALQSIEKATANLQTEIKESKPKLVEAMKKRDTAIVEQFEAYPDDKLAKSYAQAKTRLEERGYYQKAAENKINEYITNAVSQQTSDIIGKALEGTNLVRAAIGEDAFQELQKGKKKQNVTASEAKTVSLIKVDQYNKEEVQDRAINSLRKFRRLSDSARKAGNDIQNLYMQLKSQGMTDAQINASPQMSVLRDASNRVKASLLANREEFVKNYDSLAYGMPRTYIPGAAQKILDYADSKGIDVVEAIESLEKEKMIKIISPSDSRSKKLAKTGRIFLDMFKGSDARSLDHKRMHRAAVALAKQFNVMEEGTIVVNLNLIPSLTDSQYFALIDSISESGQKTLDALVEQGNYTLDEINSHMKSVNNGIESALQGLSDARNHNYFGGSMFVDVANPIIIYGGKTLESSINTFAHELGHAVKSLHFNYADSKTKIAIYREFINWRNDKRSLIDSAEGLSFDVGKKSTEMLASPLTADLDRALYDESVKLYNEGRMSASSFSAAIADINDYRLDFDEYFAEQTALYINTEKAPMGVVEKFFYDLAQRLKNLFEGIKSNSDITYEQSKTIKQFLDNVLQSEKVQTSELNSLREYDAQARITFNQTPPSQQAQNQGNRDVLLEKIRQTVEGKFTSVNQYNKIIKRVNEQLKNAGIDVLSKAEKDQILKNTEAGTLAQIESIIIKEGRKRPTKELAEIRKSLRATQAERVAAQQERDDLLNRANNASSNPLTQAEMERIDILELVGIEHASLQEKQDAIKTAKSIQKNHSLAVNNAKGTAADKQAKIEGELAIESIFGLRPDSNGVYTVEVDRRTFQVSIHDNSESYTQGDRVYRRGKIYEAREDIDAGTVFANDKWEKVGSVGIPYTKAGYITKFRQLPLVSKLTKTLQEWELPLDGMLSYLDKLATADKGSQNFSSKLVEYASRKLINAVIQTNKYISNDYQTAIDGINKVTGGKKTMDAAKKINDLRTAEVKLKFKDPNGADVEVVMTKAEVMYKYALLQDPNARPTFDAMAQNKGYDVATDMGWSQEKEQAVINAMDQEMMDIIDVFRDEVFPGVFDRVNDAHRKKFGFDIVREDNYIPWKRYVDSGSDAESYFLFDGTGDFQSIVKAVTNPSTVARTMSTAPFQSADFFEVAFRYSENASHYSTHLEPVSVLSNILQRGEVASYISSTFGKKYREIGDKLIANVATGKAAGYNRIAALDAMRTGLVLGSLGGNLTLLPKQLTSIPAYANAMNPIRWTAMMMSAPVRLMNGSLIANYRAMLETDFIKDRLQKSNVANPDLVDRTLGNIENSIGKYKGTMRLGAEIGFKKLVEALMLPTKLGDIGAILLGGEPLYSSVYNDSLKKGMSEADARAEAAFKLAEATSRTQQSDLIMDRATFQTSGSLYSLLLTFMSTPILYGRMVSAAMRDFTYKRGSKKKALAQIALFTYVLPSLFYMVSAGSLGIVFGDEEDERYDEAMISRNAFVAFQGLIQHIPVIYPLVSNLMDRMLFGNKFRASAIPTISRVEKSTEAVGNIGAKLYDSEKLQVDDILKLAREVVQLGGVNVKSAENLIENWGDITSGNVPSEDISAAIYMGMGYSKEALGLRPYGEKSKEKQRNPKPLKGREVKKSPAARKLESRKRKLNKLKNQ